MRARTSMLWALLGLSVVAQGWAELENPGQARKGLAPRETPVAKGLKIHEWGVFQCLSKGGFKASGGGEAPTFIQRIPADLKALPPDPSEAPVAVREPILHVYARADDLTRLHAEVRFPKGRPTLAWPRAERLRSNLESEGFGADAKGLATTKADFFSSSESGTKPDSCIGMENIPCLVWDLRMGAELGEAQPPKVPDNHWISAVRKVGSDMVRSADGKDAEHFLFYEGMLDYESTFQVSMALHKNEPDQAVLSGYGSKEAWVVRSDGKALSRAHLTELEETQAVDHKAQPFVRGTLETAAAPALQAELSKPLMTAGLSEAEAGALLTIWMPELAKPGTRLVYVLPRQEYNRLLPITFNPQPEELVRVGLVVKEVAP